MWVIKGNLFAAAVAIIVAALLDALDGRVARLTKSTSEFGVEFDSLADTVSFGVAPALLSYFWALNSFRRIGWIAAFAFLICGVLRLARFNTRCKTVEPKYFLGLPIPMAALAIATSVTLADAEPPGTFLRVLFLVLVAALSFLMVSSFKYRSFKELDFAKLHPFGTLITVVAVLIIIASFPRTMPFLLVLGYVVWGVLETYWLHQRLRKRPAGGSKG